MAAPRTPATPVTPVAQKAEQPTPTGTWRHPKFNEITRRQHATNFDEQNVRRIVVNSVALIFSFALFNITPKMAVLRQVQNQIIHLKDSIPYSSYVVWALRIVLLLNILHASRPLALRYFPVDDIADIPLTPSQRQTMGLDPSVQPPKTPGSIYVSPNYVTPPRYQRSSTPRTSFGTPNDRQSPLSGSPRASMAKSTSNSPFSPNTGSPLFQKAVGGGSATKRLSYDSRGSPLGTSLFGESSSSGLPGTPTPGGGKASVGLNSKWLYEKRRESPRSNLFN